MEMASQALPVEHGLWSWALQDTSDQYNAKIASLEEAMKTGKSSMPDVLRVHQE